MFKKGVIIQASSRSNGDSSLISSALKAETGFDIIDLNKKNIGHFDYEFKNENDDFRDLYNTIVTNYKTILFVTPIYWYTMSGLLKVFLDRISDFLTVEKDKGRKLRQMKMGVISCSNENVVFDGFTMPFEKSAAYLGMDYLGHLHTWVNDNTISEKVLDAIKMFSEKIRLSNV